MSEREKYLRDLELNGDLNSYAFNDRDDDETVEPETMSPTERDAIIAQAAAMLGISTDDARGMVYGTHPSGLRVYGVEYREPKVSAGPEIKPTKLDETRLWSSSAWQPECSADFDMYCLGDQATYPTPKDTTYPTTTTCGRCSGLGHVFDVMTGLDEPCASCDGTGKLDVVRPETVGYHPRIGIIRQTARVLRALGGVVKAGIRERT